MRKSTEVVTRIAPSPTGNLHIGTARTSLFNFLFARQNKGKFIIRSEDTDVKRSSDKYEKEILDGLAWLGLTHDEFYRQSERADIYTSAIKKLLDTDKAFVSKEISKDGSGNEVEVVRLRNQNKNITFTDIIRGDVTFNTSELGDFVIARSINEPLYHLAVVIDDDDMNVSHIIRGEDHISNTPRQILIQEALGIERHLYAHIPLILAADRSKLSKRKNTTVSIEEYKKEGYLPEALINYLALLGWNPGTEQEFFTLDDLIEKFSLKHIQKGGAVFNIEKLNWFNSEYIKIMPIEKLIKNIEEHMPDLIKEKRTYTKERLKEVAIVLRERISHFSEIKKSADEGELDYYFEAPLLSSSNLLLPKKEEENVENTKKRLLVIEKYIKTIPTEHFNKEKIKDALWDYASEEGRGLVLWPMRVALSGKERSSDPFTIAAIIGKQETLKRLLSAHELLKNEN